MNIKPLADRVLIKPAPAEEKTAGGIIIPDTAKEKPLQGEVLAAGNGTKDEEMVLKAGDTVKIPVSLAGLKEDQYLSGISCNVAAMDSYLTVTGVEFASSIDSWSGGYNDQHKSVNKVNLTFAERPEDCLHRSRSSSRTI
mgnify:CR=1 FL=1